MVDFSLYALAALLGATGSGEGAADAADLVPRLEERDLSADPPRSDWLFPDVPQRHGAARNPFPWPTRDANNRGDARRHGEVEDPAPPPAEPRPTGGVDPPRSPGPPDPSELTLPNGGSPEGERHEAQDGVGDAEGDQSSPLWLPLAITLAALFVSLGGNVYLGWIAVESRTRYWAIFDEYMKLNPDGDRYESDLEEGEEGIENRYRKDRQRRKKRTGDA